MNKKTTLHIIFFLLFITIIPFSLATTIEDYLDDAGNLRETITVNGTIKSITLPNTATNIDVKGSLFSVNESSVQLESCLEGCSISYSIKNIVSIDKGDYVYSRNLKPFDSLTYKVYLPIGSIVDLSQDNIVPQPDQITSDGTYIIILWNVNQTQTTRYYVKYGDHESQESYIQEIQGELKEREVIIMLALLFCIGFILGYIIKKEKEVAVVTSQLLTSDEKNLLNEINKQYKEQSKPITQKFLGEKLSWSKSKVSAIMALLSQKRLVKKEKVGRNYRVEPLSKVSSKKESHD